MLGAKVHINIIPHLVHHGTKQSGGWKPCATKKCELHKLYLCEVYVETDVYFIIQLSLQRGSRALCNRCSLTRFYITEYLPLNVVAEASVSLTLQKDFITIWKLNREPFKIDDQRIVVVIKKREVLPVKRETITSASLIRGYFFSFSIRYSAK